MKFLNFFVFLAFVGVIIGVSSDCTEKDYVDTLKIGYGIGANHNILLTAGACIPGVHFALVSTLATIGACIPFVGIPAVVAGILSSTVKMTHVINVSTCLRNKVSSLPNECRVPMTSIAAATGVIQTTTASLEALSVIPLAGCLLLTPKLALMKSNAVAIDKYADQWKERNCHIYMPSGCSCDLF
ncbi:unnamed protein product [Macrosiphum euphorbiae]|uniref:Uncharacterized protein n=1 Tax=Macrosiphum euphorbiae TaxID=13131 RepID=A0AAV0XBL1_9HEMI|nr:unnamed protein product [Macrosiphum euphorbiae]